MRKIKFDSGILHASKLFLLIFGTISLLTSCHKFPDFNRGPNLKDFVQINLVSSSNQYHPLWVDPVLKNAWGLAWSSGGTPWLGAQAGHVSTVYDREGTQARPPVNIPSPGGPTGGNPTGVVFSGSNTDFILPPPNNQAARFIFVGVDGILSAWNGNAGNNAMVIKNNAKSAAYTGLTLATNLGKNYLYAANFATGRIDVFDNAFNAVSMPFLDPQLPAGYAPFNIENIDGLLYVLYAKVAANGQDEPGMGKGYVSVFTADGIFIKRWLSGGELNAPWGIAKAPANFFGDDNMDPTPTILVGNFGNGHINAYTPEGKCLGELCTQNGPIVIDGLWAINFAPAASGIGTKRLYFTAGPDDETQGIFGYIIKKSSL